MNGAERERFIKRHGREPNLAGGGLTMEREEWADAIMERVERVRRETMLGAVYFGYALREVIEMAMETPGHLLFLPAPRLRYDAPGDWLNMFEAFLRSTVKGMEKKHLRSAVKEMEKKHGLAK